MARFALAAEVVAHGCECGEEDCPLQSHDAHIGPISVEAPDAITAITEFWSELIARGIDYRMIHCAEG